MTASRLTAKSDRNDCGVMQATVGNQRDGVHDLLVDLERLGLTA